MVHVSNDDLCYCNIVQYLRTYSTTSNPYFEKLKKRIIVRYNKHTIFNLTWDGKKSVEVIKFEKTKFRLTTS